MKSNLFFTKTRTAGAVIALLFLLPLCSFSQSNFRKGYYVDTRNDTIRGFINYKELAGNPRSFSFRSYETAAQSQDLSISQVRYFSVEGYQDFERHFVSITLDDMLPDGMNELKTGTISDTVFLKVLMKGNNLDLFSYTDKIKTRYYVKEATGKSSPMELLYKQEKDRLLPIFQQQLSTLAIKFNKLSDQVNNNIRSARYTRPSIGEIVSEINDHAKASFSEVKDKKQKLRFFIGAGVNHNKLKYEGSNIVTYESSSQAGPITYRDKSTSGFAPAFSIGLDLFSNPDIQRLVIRNELSTSFLKSHTRSVYTFYYPEEQVAYEYDLSAMMIAYSPQIIYNAYNGKTLKWNIGAGPSFYFWNYSKNQSHQKPLTQSTIYSDMVTNDYMKLNKSTVGLVARSGFTFYNRIDIGLKALINPAVISNKERTTSMKVSMINFGVNYLFTRKQ